MARERTLLERIAAAGGPTRQSVAASATEDVQALIESVRRHLRRLLNSRHGLSEALPDYGLPAMTDLTVGSRDYAQALQEAVRKAVEKYEPRLRRVQVTSMSRTEPRLSRAGGWACDPQRYEPDNGRRTCGRRGSMPRMGRTASRATGTGLRIPAVADRSVTC